MFLIFLDDINSNDVTSTLSSDGVLTITAPRRSLPPPNSERVVPITQTGSAAPKTVTTNVEGAGAGAGSGDNSTKVEN